MKSILFFTGIFILLSISCINYADKNVTNSNLPENIFTDSTLQQIMQHQYDRNTKALLVFLDNKEAKYRKAAAMALGSVQDTLALSKLRDLLQDKTPDVRIAAAFAIGQTIYPKSAVVLFARFEKEDKGLVKKQILEAIGKCGNKKSLQNIVDLKIGFANNDVLAGKAIALARFSIREIFTDKALKEAVRLIASKEASKSVKYNASIALSRLKINLPEAQLGSIISAYDSIQDIDTKMNLVLGAGKCKTDKSRLFLQSVMDNAKDYRLKVNALRSLSSFGYQSVRENYFKSLNDTNLNVAIAASEYFLAHGINEDADKYDKFTTKIKNWRVAANLLAAAIKFTNNKKSISKSVINLYKTTQNNYAKAWLLAALGNDLSNFEFVKDEVFSAKAFIISTMGMEALATMRQSSEFDKYHKTRFAKDGENIETGFANVFKKAILSGDEALISIASGVIRNPKLNYKTQYKSTDFLTTALNDCKLPKQLEAYLEIQKTIAFFNDTEQEKMPKLAYRELNWEDIAEIKTDEKIEIRTTKGNFTIQLNVNDNPATVSAFISLIKSGFYKDKHIHRVVPNFVIQDGCPRGDGWGSPDFTIRSEFYNSYFKEGSLGMASAGKDTESSQWFVTYSPTPHLDGRYTKFGKVIKGMDVVHKLEVGDEIENIYLLE